MKSHEWETPNAIAIPKETDHLQKGKYGPVFEQSPACYGFTLIANVKPGTAGVIREYGVKLSKALEPNPHLLAPLKTSLPAMSAFR